MRNREELLLQAALIQNRNQTIIQQPSQNENVATQQAERLETSDFQSVDLMSVSNSVKQISPPQIPNMKESVHSVKKANTSSVNQSMFETPNFALEESNASL